MTTELPPEMRAMNAAMDLVFNAVTKPIAIQPIQRDIDDLPEQTSKRQIDIESAIMTCPGFDYITAWELTAAIQARLENVYEEKLNSKVDEAIKKLRAELDHITG